MGEDCGRILKASDTLADLLVRDPAALTGAPVLGILHQADRDRAIGEFARLTAGVISLAEGDVRLRCGNGSVRWARACASLAPTGFSDGVILRFTLLPKLTLLTSENEPIESGLGGTGRRLHDVSRSRAPNACVAASPTRREAGAQHATPPTSRCARPREAALGGV